MGKDFLGLRDQGCRGAWAILRQAQALLSAAPAAKSAIRIAVHIQENGENAPGVQTCAQSWEDTARLLGGVVLPLMPDSPNSADILSALSGMDATVLAVAGSDASTLREVAAGTALPVINAGNDTAAPCPALAEILYLCHARGQDEPVDGLRLGWLGRADGKLSGLVRSLLDAALCFQHEFFLAFPQGHGPEPEHLDFAMNAGGKIFLSHSPCPVVDGCHEIVAAPWLETDSGKAVLPRHPLLSDTEVMRAARGIPVWSLVPEIPDSDTTGTRQHCLAACQAALVLSAAS